MKYLLPVLCAAAFACAQQPLTPLPPPAAPAPPVAVANDTVVLTVGDLKITKAQFEEIMSDNLSDQQRAQAQTPAGRRRIAESLAQISALAQEAKVRKLDQKPKVQAQIKLQTEQVLASAAFQDLAETTKLDDAMLQAYYDAHKSEWETIKAKHILIRFHGSQVPLKAGGKDLTDAEALAKITEVRAKIVAGAKFEDLAKAESDDNPALAGDLQPFTKGKMAPPFEKAAFEAKVGEVTEPVKTQFGYHIILVESHTTKTFDQARPEIEQKIKPQLAQQALTDLKKKTNIVYDENYFGK